MNQQFHLFIFFIPFALFSQSFSKEAKEHSQFETAFSSPPAWSKNAIWYELSVERFRNGDKSNDPKPEDIEGTYPGFVPDGWSVTPWVQDWYKEDDYFEDLSSHHDSFGNSMERFVDKVQLRRYGGDLKGVLEKIDYLDSLGVTAIYFRPLNDAPSLHKYDARNWRHIDINFGPSPERDKKLISSEVPDDPSTWKSTEADKLFIKVIEEFHNRNIKVILDYSWNHTGEMFWAWQDVLKHQDKSRYKDWYWIESFDKKETQQNEFSYHGWAGVPNLPEIKETVKQNVSVRLEPFEGDIFDSSAKAHILNVAGRWLDPNGDGDPKDGVDGFRLDVAAETPLGFWRDFRKYVRKINPDAYLLGEIWWEEWPDRLLDPEPFLKGDIFDAVMNYRWYRAVRHFFNEAPDRISADELVDSLKSFSSNLRKENNYAMMNYTGGFDTPRILTSLFNKNKYKYKCKAHENPDYKIHKPDLKTYETLRLLLVQQYTYVGSPHIYAGDEMGMWGADDPSSRKPLIWPDLSFEDEVTHPLGQKRPRDQVKFNHGLFQFHKKLIGIRKTRPLLSKGNIEYLKITGNEGILAYSRFDNKNEMIAVFNSLHISRVLRIPKKYDFEYQDILYGIKVDNSKESLLIELPARSACLLVHEAETKRP